MTGRTPPDTTVNASLVKRHLARMDLAVASIKLEASKLPKRAASAGQELVECLDNIAALRDSFGDPTHPSEAVVRDLASLASVLDEILQKVKNVVVVSTTLRRYISTESPESKIRKCRIRVADMISRISISPAAQPQSLTGRQGNPLSKNSLSRPQDPGTESNATPLWTKVLAPAKNTFQGVAAVTPLMSVTGPYIQCGVDVGNILIEILAGTSQTNDLTSALSDRVSQLSNLVSVFLEKERTYCTSGSLLKCLDQFKSHCDPIQKASEFLATQARLGKSIFARYDAEIIDRLNHKIDQALDVLSLYLLLNAQYLERIRERDQLLDRLGDGYFGEVNSSKAEGLCLKDTRVEILGRIDAWTYDTSSPGGVLWVKGQTGRGKSTIARTAISNFAAKGKGSSAIFHFRQGNDTLNKRVVSALARQIARSDDERVSEAFLQAIRNHQDIAQSSIDDQFKRLIAEPLQKLKNSSAPILFVIDGLDECADRGLIRAFLRSIHDLVSSSSFSSVKFLITSRPEHHIVKSFEKLPHSPEDLDKDDSEGIAIQDDLQKYYQDRLKSIGSLEEKWKGADVVDKLVDRSERLFQWANAAMLYIEHSPAPHVSLRKIVEDEVNVRGLDRLYTEILSSAFPSDWCDNAASLSLLQHVLGSLAISPHPISLSILRYLWSDATDPTICSREEDQIHGDVLTRLSLLLTMPGRDSPEAEIHFVHTSVRDFLMKKTEDTDHRFFIDPPLHHARLARVCFNRMKRDLLPGFCDFQELSQTNDDVRDRVKTHVSAGLAYCCRSWSAHVTEVVHDKSPSGCAVVHGLLDDFCRKQLLNWLEVLSLSGVALEAVRMAAQSSGWLAQHKESGVPNEDYNTSTLLHDVCMFGIQFRGGISLSARYISRSVMAYCPKGTALWRLYGSTNGPSLRILRGPSGQTWSNTILAKGGDSQGVHSLAFSRDGKILAAGCTDNTIRLWNTETGTPVREPLKGHSLSVLSVAFSGDGRMLASGSDDNTIRLWDLNAGAPLGKPLKGHSGAVCTLAFSNDGKMLASGSRDASIRLWNPKSGKPIGKPLRGRSHYINSVAFSNDGELLASGSSDNAIRLWSSRHGALIGKPLKGHTGPVNSVAFSSDRKTLATGSGDHTVRLWNVESRKTIGGALKGHSDDVLTVAFSGDEKMLFSAAKDDTVRSWNTESGMAIGEPLEGNSGSVKAVAFSNDEKMLVSASELGTIRLSNREAGAITGAPLKGHSDMVWSVAFSGDGKMLASGSMDNTICLWDLQSGAAVGKPLKGHSGRVCSLAFSGDGKILASGSYDHTIRLWSVEDGTPLGEPLDGHSDWVYSVAFSSNGKMLASGSHDGTIHLWNPETGATIGEPLEGHTKGVRSVAFSADGKILASGADDGTIRLWNPESGTPIGEPLSGKSGSVYNVAFSGDGKILASGHFNNTVRLWNPETGAPIGEPLTGHTHSVLRVAFSNDGTSLFSESNNEIMTWNVSQLAHDGPSPKLPLITSKIRMNWHNQSHGKKGWVFRDDAPWFWMPEEFWDDNGRSPRMSFSGNAIVVWHRKMHVLDVSEII